jgi:hypothetical protein
MDINEWFAKKCGVTIDSVGGGYVFRGVFYGWGWTIQDPRCREIIREKFKIDTCEEDSGLGKWCASCYINGVYRTEGYGKTIAEAEIACLEAIYKAEVEK